MRKLPFFDWKLLAPVFVLLIISLATLFSIDQALFRSQLISLFISLIIYLLIVKIDFKVFCNLALPFYLISVFLFLIVLLLGIESHGAVRWIDIFGLRLQFSEVMKPFLALSFAAYLTSRPASFWQFLKIFLLLFPVLLLIFFQPDLGNTLIYLFVVVFSLLTAGFSFSWFFVLLLPFLLLLPIFWSVLHDYQRQRILTFFQPGHDPLGKSYNVVQAVIAVGSGMLVGRGFGQGTQSMLRFLPERHTDFIFATLAEGLGFLGTLVVVVAFAFLFWRIYKIYQETEDAFAKVFVSCAFAFLLINFFVNIGMNMGLVPIVGVTLPFVSFGGSSLLSNFIFLGVLSSISARVKKDVLEIR